MALSDNDQILLDWRKHGLDSKISCEGVRDFFWADGTVCCRYDSRDKVPRGNWVVVDGIVTTNNISLLKRLTSSVLAGLKPPGVSISELEKLWEKLGQQSEDSHLCYKECWVAGLKDGGLVSFDGEKLLCQSDLDYLLMRCEDLTCLNDWQRICAWWFDHGGQMWRDGHFVYEREVVCVWDYQQTLMGFPLSIPPNTQAEKSTLAELKVLLEKLINRDPTDRKWLESMWCRCPGAEVEGDCLTSNNVRCAKWIGTHYIGPKGEILDSLKLLATVMAEAQKLHPKAWEVADIIKWWTSQPGCDVDLEDPRSIRFEVLGEVVCDWWTEMALFDFPIQPADGSHVPGGLDDLKAYLLTIQANMASQKALRDARETVKILQEAVRARSEVVQAHSQSLQAAVSDLESAQLALQAAEARLAPLQ